MWQEIRRGFAQWHEEGRGLQLTQAGEYLLAVVQRMLSQIDHVAGFLELAARLQPSPLE